MLVLLVAFAVPGWTQAPPTGSCGKNVSFAVAEAGQPVPAIPKFTSKWLEGKGRREAFSKLCFSQVPSEGLTNYIVVFSTTSQAFDGLKASAHTYKTTSPGRENAAAVNSYGGTWSYAYNGAAPPATTATVDLKRDDKPKSVSVRVFDQTGRTVSQGDLQKFSSRDKLLEKMLTDVVNDSPPAMDRKSFASPLSVYYVNCDIDGAPASPAMAMGDPPAAVKTVASTSPAAPPPPPPPALDIWSSPPGADIFVDGAFVGKTPYSMTLSAGEHIVNLRKKDFAIWQRKVEVTAGKRRVGTNLEQKVLNLE